MGFIGFISKVLQEINGFRVGSVQLIRGRMEQSWVGVGQHPQDSFRELQQEFSRSDGSFQHKQLQRLFLDDECL
jgi:uncharacterized lipoprotein